MSANLKYPIVLLFILALTSMECRAADETQELRVKAEQGDAKAQTLVGFHYEMLEEYEEAAKWSYKAAKQGIVGAQVYLADMYIHGRGVPQDSVD